MKRFFIRLAGSCLSGIGCVTNALGFFESNSDTTKINGRYGIQYIERTETTPIVFRINYSALFDDIGTFCNGNLTGYPTTGSNGGAHTYSNLGERGCLCGYRDVYCKLEANETGTGGSTGSGAVQQQWYDRYNFNGVSSCVKDQNVATGGNSTTCKYVVINSGSSERFQFEGCLAGFYLEGSAIAGYSQWYSNFDDLTGFCKSCSGYRGMTGFVSGGNGNMLRIYQFDTYTPQVYTGDSVPPNYNTDEVRFMWYANGKNSLNTPTGSGGASSAYGIETCKAYLQSGTSGFTDSYGTFIVQSGGCPYVND